MGTKHDTRAQSNERNESTWHICTCDALPHFHVKKKVTASQKQHRTVHPSPVCTESSDRSALMYESETAMFVSTVVTVCNFCCYSYNESILFTGRVLFL